ncbi:HD domain-containing phosphohydrolase [Thalassotalea sp. PLHSN55]|uniref:HD domain-containing phosphohydrolase n=1 Tax=Thalassotalea sp. PLHSN55 TaxID=3435888 RepID=UPI003F8264A5
MSQFIFKDENEQDEQPPKASSKKKWRILVVDDDDSVHQVTKLVLSNTEIENRQLEITSVYSSEEAQKVLSNDSSYCMAFVDVVMETDHAGLELVEWIRKDLKNQAIRLVLRTGQAGTAPESKVIREFDINDYKEKTDFTSGKMITTVYASIRAYRDIMTIQRSLDAFKQLIKATHDLLKIEQFKPFASAALNHLLTLMDVESSALYIARSQVDFELERSDMIIACTGKYFSESSSLESSDISQSVKDIITQVFHSQSHFLGDDCFVGYYETGANVASVLYIEFEDDAEHFRANLAELYASNVALILEKITKQQEVERTQKELLYVVSESIEARSKETGAHVRRVADICELLALKLNLSTSFIDAIKLAAPLHDLGKIGIPESILHKPGKLNDEEWETMKKHAEIGGELLAKSNSSISKLGSRLARYHHENWDGSGYPEGLSGLDIPIEARIMAISDVFDALGSNRCYKSKWDNDAIKQFLIEEKGKKFDPTMIELFIESFDEFAAIRANYPDED